MKKTELGEVSTAIAPSTADGKLGTFFRTCGRQRHLLYLAAPAFLVVFVFTYLPMYGVVVSFQNFHFVRGVFGSPWVGLRWFESFFASPFAFRIIRNTFLLGFLNFAIGFPAPILLALLLKRAEIGRVQAVHTDAVVLPELHLGSHHHRNPEGARRAGRAR